MSIQSFKDCTVGRFFFNKVEDVNYVPVHMTDDLKKRQIEEEEYKKYGVKKEHLFDFK